MSELEICYRWVPDQEGQMLEVVAKQKLRVLAIVKAVLTVDAHREIAELYGVKVKEDVEKTAFDCCKHLAEARLKAEQERTPDTMPTFGKDPLGVLGATPAEIKQLQERFGGKDWKPKY